MRVLCLALVYLVRSCSVVISGGVIFFSRGKQRRSRSWEWMERKLLSGCNVSRGIKEKKVIF